MAGGYPICAQWAPVGVNTLSSSGGVVLTSSASNNTVGPYSQLIASTARDSTWIAVNLRDMISTTGLTVSAVNIAVGGSGSEVVIISNLVVTRASISAQEGGGANYLLPLVIPAGSRVAANCQSLGTSVTIRCAVMLFDDAFASVLGGGMVDTYGFNAGTTIGTAVDPGTSANTKGAWSQITASTTYDIAGFTVAFDGQNATPGSAIVSIDLDIGIGGSGSEVVLLGDWQSMMTCTSSGRRDVNPATLPFLPIPIPAGSRIAARAASSNTTATTRVFGLTFYGVRA